MADEELSGQATESEGTPNEIAANADAQAETAVAEKMDEIFSHNDEQQQTDELEQSGVTGPDNPEGLDQPAPVAKQTEDQPEEVELADASLEQLKDAEKEAASAGDYENAMAIRDRIKEVEAASPKSEASSVAKKGVLSADDRTLMKELGGWSDEELNELETTNPALAKVTARNTSKQYNALSLQYAQVARNGVAPLTQPTPTQNATTQQQNGSLDALYKDLEKFSEVAGSEMVERFIKPLKSEVIEPLREAMTFINQQRQQAVVKEVNDAFERVSKNGFEDQYGKADALNDKQRAFRQQVAQAADQIATGARAQQVPMSYGEAIQRAHLILTANQQQAQARKQLTKEVKKRSTQITSRPSQRIPASKKVGEAAAAAAVSDFWESRD